MDKTLITPLDGIKPRAFADRDTAAAFINKVAILIFVYIVLVLYPAYGVLRWFWNPDFPIVDLEGAVKAVITGVLFALFARRSIFNRVVVQVEKLDHSSQETAQQTTAM